MNNIIIIGEGPTEQAFCNDVLQPFFNEHELYLENPTIKKTRGGIVPWEVLKKEIKTHLTNSSAVVTTLIDYYGIKAEHNFPGWEDSRKIPNRPARMDFLENAMIEDIPDSVRYRFIPYIQLHEFEALLFSDITAIESNFETEEFRDPLYLIKTYNEFPNPEDINDGKDTAPSKRLNTILEGYSKVVYGSLLAQEIGLDTIRAKCFRFNQWIENLLKVKKI
jgi:hypothetical protein